MSRVVQLKLKDGRTVIARSYGFGWITVKGENIHRTQVKSKKVIPDESNPN